MKLEKTTTSIFLTPVIGISKAILDSFEYLNGYSDYVDKELIFDDHIVYLLFKPKNRPKFQKFVDRQYIDNAGILEDFDLRDEFVVLTYKLNKELDDDYVLIKMGKYSKTSKKFQEIFPSEIKIHSGVKFTRRKTLQKMIFDKDSSLSKYWEKKIKTKDISENNMEVWYNFDIEKETLNIDNVITELQKKEEKDEQREPRENSK